MQEHQQQLQERLDAVKIYYKHDGDMKAAVKAFKAAHPQHNPTTVQEFISTWVKNLSAQFCLFHKNHPGRPPLITDEEAMQASLAFASDKYTSVKDAMSKDPHIKQLIQRKGVSEQMLRRRMWQVNPLLVLHNTKILRDLSVGEKGERLACAMQLQHLTDEELDRVVWLDAKTIWVNHDRLRAKVYGMRGFADPDALRILVHNVTARGIRLKFFTGVNKKVGPVFMSFTSETTDLYCKEIHEMLTVSGALVLLLLLLLVTTDDISPLFYTHLSYYCLNSPALGRHGTAQ